MASAYPGRTGDVALFLKEMPRFERNYPGHGRALLHGLAVRHLDSFPSPPSARMAAVI
ncbi:MAG: hypothetical protein R3C44_00660 [Chloroflexota bacterium]